MMILFQNDIEKLKDIVDSHSKTFILCDGNTINYCLPLFFEAMMLSDFSLIEIPSGEKNKNIDTVQDVWRQLLENHADRKSLLINLGGGMVSDLGGFAASCYQRGIDFVNVPTTLLSMVDASVGGKTGVDFQGVKNQIGIFAKPIAVMVMPVFLQTLPEREMLSGLGEMVKYGFISDKSFLDIDSHFDMRIVKKAIEIKETITREDFKEQGLRKCLNFGHTVGHALEALWLDSQENMSHGEAVALGMLPALTLSEKFCGLNRCWISRYIDIYKRLFKKFDGSHVNMDNLLAYMRHDKKNADGVIRFVMIFEPEKPIVDVPVNESDIVDAVRFMINELMVC